MITRDNTDIELNIWPDKGGNARLKRYYAWLDERKIKYSMVRHPTWASYPTSINMRNEDAVAFKLAFKMDYTD
jgi:hypothetical protein